MARLTPKQQNLYEDIRKVKDQVSEEYLKRPGIQGIGVGFKCEEGKPTNQLAIRFYVKEKKKVLAEEMIPSMIQEIPTDVIEAEFKNDPLARPLEDKEKEEIMRGLLAVDKEKYDPLVGGVSIAPSRKYDVAGTLGLMVKDATSGVPMMLSNFHVMCGEDGRFQKDDEICQPSRADTITGWCSNCAKLDRWFVGNFLMNGVEYGLDCAVAKQIHRDQSFNTIKEIPPHDRIDKLAQLNMGVIKRGRTTGYTEGTITDAAVNAVVDMGPPYGRITLKNMMLIQGNNGINFSDFGDSGSMIVTNNSESFVGMLQGIKTTTGVTVATQITPVLQQLNIII